MKKIVTLMTLVAISVFLSGSSGCDQQVQSVSGTKMTTAGHIGTGPDGLTVEQHNVSERIKMDNNVGAIKHLYVISAYSGQVLIYSTVKGKVTSSGKRLTPDRVEGNANGTSFGFDIGGVRYFTYQVLGEDGTYGSSIEYLYWWDAKGAYHQHYVTGGQILHISDQPIAVKEVIINMEVVAPKPAEQPTGKK